MSRLALLLGCIALVLIAVNAELIMTPSGEYIDHTAIGQGSHHARSAEDSVCGSAHMNFLWGLTATRSVMSATIFFYQNGTFHDSTYNYDGSWVYFGREGDATLFFEYPSALYCSPDDTGSGTMISGNTCGTWDFDDLKWTCDNMCY
mmetsp:Transcript_28532/g.40123  ORF Transcript_28532/g.40123 Transcript_28532/m.40123 type:complete len:147 (+) Transcript_28532:17-457(+)